MKHGVDRKEQLVEVWYIRSAVGTSGVAVGEADGASVVAARGIIVGAGVI
jgi:hypothetical protein